MKRIEVIGHLFGAIVIALMLAGFSSNLETVRAGFAANDKLAVGLLGTGCVQIRFGLRKGLAEQTTMLLLRAIIGRGSFWTRVSRLSRKPDWRPRLKEQFTIRAGSRATGNSGDAGYQDRLLPDLQEVRSRDER